MYRQRLEFRGIHQPIIQYSHNLTVGTLDLLSSAQYVQISKYSLGKLPNDIVVLIEKIPKHEESSELPMQTVFLQLWLCTYMLRTILTFF